MELKIGHNYKIQFSHRFFGGSIIIAQFIEYKEKMDGYVVKLIKPVKWCGYYWQKPTVGREFIIGKENFIKEV